MPSESSVPLDISALCRRNAVELSDARWDYDVSGLIDAVQDALRERGLDVSDAYSESFNAGSRRQASSARQMCSTGAIASASSRRGTARCRARPGRILAARVRSSRTLAASPSVAVGTCSPSPSSSISATERSMYSTAGLSGVSPRIRSPASLPIDPGNVADLRSVIGEALDEPGLRRLIPRPRQTPRA